MSYPYPQHCAVKLIRWDLNETEAVEANTEFLVPLPCQVCSAVGVSTEQASALIGAVCFTLLHQLGSVEQSYVSILFANRTPLQFDFSSETKIRNPHIMRGIHGSLFFRKIKIKKQQRNKGQSRLDSKFHFNTYFSSDPIPSLLQLHKD